jgi:hypothetical protein
MVGCLGSLSECAGLGLVMVTVLKEVFTDCVNEVWSAKEILMVMTLK